MDKDNLRLRKQLNWGQQEEIYVEKNNSTGSGAGVEGALKIRVEI